MQYSKWPSPHQTYSRKILQVNKMGTWASLLRSLPTLVTQLSESNNVHLGSSGERPMLKPGEMRVWTVGPFPQIWTYASSVGIILEHTGIY